MRRTGRVPQRFSLEKHQYIFRNWQPPNFTLNMYPVVEFSRQTHMYPTLGIRISPSSSNIVKQAVPRKGCGVRSVLDFVSGPVTRDLRRKTPNKHDYQITVAAATSIMSAQADMRRPKTGWKHANAGEMQRKIKAISVAWTKWRRHITCKKIQDIRIFGGGGGRSHIDHVRPPIKKKHPYLPRKKNRAVSTIFFASPRSNVYPERERTTRGGLCRRTVVPCRISRAADEDGRRPERTGEFSLKRVW